MKKLFALSMIVLMIVSITAFVVYFDLLGETKEKKFYVGVTYCGNSTEEAKLLIDRVKSYTNLFVLQSGLLQKHPDNITAIGDYAVSSGMHFVVYFGTDSSWLMKTWLDSYDGHWNDRFLGVYFGDERGGKMLDGKMDFYDQETQGSIRKMADRSISGYKVNGNSSTSMRYWQDGLIILDITETNGEPQFTDEGDPNPNYVNKHTRISYYPNGTITAEIRENSNTATNEQNEIGTSPNGNITLQIGNDTNPYKVIDNYNATFTYEELWNVRPFQSYDETAERFIRECNFAMSRYGPQNFTFLTSDYALYWFDYKAGYDVVMAQFGWNHTLAQDIALVRGAAELQNKTWGAIITWKYNNPPYLDSGEAIYDQMRAAYEAGAEYVVIFNYAEDMEGPYGTLQDEHFAALERFWNEVVQSSAVKQGSIEAEAVLVLPKNYGWGMRHPEDKIWGLWGPDEKSQQIWELSQNLLDQYGLGLDIVYEDSSFPVAGNYPQIYYWNHTG